MTSVVASAFAGIPAGASADEHDQSPHRRCAKKPFHRDRAVPRPGWVGLVGTRRDPDRRDPRPLGQPGDRLYRLVRAQPAGGRGSDHVPAHHEPAGPGWGARGPIAIGVRVLDGLRHLRGQHRSVLRAQPRPRAHEPRQQGAPGWSRADAGTGRDGRRPRLLVHRREPLALTANSARCRTGSFVTN
jgi:hypothetical protein